MARKTSEKVADESFVLNVVLNMASAARDVSENPLLFGAQVRTSTLRRVVDANEAQLKDSLALLGDTVTLDTSTLFETLLAILAVRYPGYEQYSPFLFKDADLDESEAGGYFDNLAGS